MSFSIKKIYLLLFFQIFTLPAFAQKPAADMTFSEHMALDPAKDLSTVFVDSSKSKQILYIGGLTSIALGTVFRTSIVDKVQNDFQSHHYLGGGSAFGDIMGQLVPNVLYFGGQAAAQRWWAIPLGYQRAALMFKTTLYAGSFTLLLKNIVQEKRPNGGDNYSFPSGHTTTAFAFASVVALEHEWYWGVASYSLATFVAASRINDNAHYLHDVLAGAVIGTSFGVGLSQLYGSNNTSDNKESNTAMHTLIMPTNDGMQMTTQWSF